MKPPVLSKKTSASSGHDDGSIRLWNLETGTTVDLQQHTNTVTCLVMAQVSDSDELLFSTGKCNRPLPFCIQAFAGYEFFLLILCVHGVRWQHPNMIPSNVPLAGEVHHGCSHFVKLQVSDCICVEALIDNMTNDHLLRFKPDFQTGSVHSFAAL